MAAKRIYQIAKEFERDEKEIIAFLTSQGVKVANRLSAVSEDTYNMLKTKYTAPPEPEPVPEPPKPEPETAKVEPPDQSETPAPSAEGAGFVKKKKKKQKSFQPADGEQIAGQPQGELSPALSVDNTPVDEPNESTQAIIRNAVVAGNEFIKNYHLGMNKKKIRALKLKLSRYTDTWAILQDIKFEYPDATPVRYWQAVNKITTRAFRLINEYGMYNREILAEMRNLMMPFGLAYVTQEIFTDEENQLFEAQQKMIFRRFGHGMGKVNDNLYALKMHAENMKARCEFMDFVEYVTNPDAELRSKNRVPFIDMVEEVAFSMSGIVRRVDFYVRNKERITNVLKNFVEWRDGYAKLKEQGASADKLEKYLALEKKFVDLVEYMSFDNLLSSMHKKVIPFDKALDLLNAYRDNMDDPDAKRDFQYKVRGITQLVYKPKEFIFLYQFADLQTGKDYRPPEEIAAAQAAKAAAEAAAQAEVVAQDEDSSDADPTDEKENPVDKVGKAIDSEILG